MHRYIMYEFPVILKSNFSQYSSWSTDYIILYKKVYWIVLLQSVTIVRVSEVNIIEDCVIFANQRVLNSELWISSSSG